MTDHQYGAAEELKRAATSASELLAGLDALMHDQGSAYALGQAAVALRGLVRAAEGLR